MPKQTNSNTRASTLGWQVIVAVPLYGVAAYWPGLAPSALKVLGLGDWNPILLACAVTLTALIIMYVSMIANLVLRRIAMNMNAVESIVDDETRDDRIAAVADDIDATYRIQAVWVHLSVASGIAAVAWWNVGSVEAALAHAVAALIATVLAPRGAGYIARKVWQRIVGKTVQHERSKNPWNESDTRLQSGPRRKQIAAE